MIFFARMSVSRLAASKQTSAMRFGMEMWLLAKWVFLILHIPTCLENNKGQLFCESNKQHHTISLKNNRINGFFCVNTGPQPKFVEHRPGIQLGFRTFTAVLFNLEATNEPVVSMPCSDMMNANDGHLAQNMRKQEITEKMRAVFRVADRC